MESFEKETEGPELVRATQKRIHLSSSRKSERSLGLISKDPIQIVGKLEERLMSASEEEEEK